MNDGKHMMRYFELVLLSGDSILLFMDHMLRRRGIGARLG